MSYFLGEGALRPVRFRDLFLVTVFNLSKNFGDDLSTYSEGQCKVTGFWSVSFGPC